MRDQTDIETKIAFLEKHITELSDVLYRQQQSIDLLNLKFEKLDQQHQNGEEQTFSDQNKPPHY